MDLSIVLKVFYAVMVAIVLSLMGFYVRGLTKTAEGAVPLRAKALFTGWIVLLVAIGIGFHVLTTLYVPWVSWELKRPHLKPDREIVVHAKQHRFELPEGGIQVRTGEMIKFRVLSEDLTYGFGVFRSSGGMEFQIQVIPGHANEVLWKFSEPGLYSIRCTEYAGVETGQLYGRNAIAVSPALAAGSIVAGSAAAVFKALPTARKETTAIGCNYC